MKKSGGLADSPFFAIHQKINETAATPLSPTEPEVPAVKETIKSPDSPTPERKEAALLQSQSEIKQDQKRTNVLSDVRTDERTSERTNVRTIIKPKRRKIRHAFDIYQDQLISLQMRQLEAVQRGKRKPKLGKMVQEAIDQYLKHSQNKKS